MKIKLLALLATSLLAGDYLEELQEYLSSKSFDIDGYFFPYDFNKDGRLDPNDWIYLSTTTGQAYRLLATTPTSTNAFGFAPVSIPNNLGEPDGYFVFINFPLDRDARFSWVYVRKKNLSVYKLMGANPDNTFRYLDITGDGIPDPLPIEAEVRNYEVYFYTPSSSSYSSYYNSYEDYYSSSDDYEEDDHYSYSSLSHEEDDDDHYSSSYYGDDYSYSSYVSSSANSTYTLLAWNDLGMHCMDEDYSVFSILPPYNTLVAQLIKKGEEPIHIKEGVVLTYEAFPSLKGTINSFSDGKTNFWKFVEPLYLRSLPPNVGLTNTPTVSKTPNLMKFDSKYNWWVAEGIPITPIDNDGSFNPYPLVKVTAKDSSGNILAQTVTVLPVSSEMDCKSCHSSTSNYLDAKPKAGWVALSDPIKDYRFNILRLHDQEHPDAVKNYLSQLQAKGYNYLEEGLEATAKAGTPILCASCHKSNALPNSGIEGISPLTSAIHSLHAKVKDPITQQELNSINSTSTCYKCHPGTKTNCFRGAMSKDKISCQDCHGTMSAVGDKGREGWLDEPNCESCHQQGKRYEVAVVDRFKGTLREAIDNRFAVNKNVPLSGKSLYRFSKGHGELSCMACHGSTHAIYPSSKEEDNLQSIMVQGHKGTIAECTACHNTIPRTANKGPHGMHSIGEWWIEEHGDYAEYKLSECASCHGEDYKGSDLSKTFSTRVYYTEYGTKNFEAGHKVSCYDCHNGPYEDD